MVQGKLTRWYDEKQARGLVVMAIVMPRRPTDSYLGIVTDVPLLVPSPPSLLPQLTTDPFFAAAQATDLRGKTPYMATPPTIFLPSSSPGTDVKPMGSIGSPIPTAQLVALPSP